MGYLIPIMVVVFGMAAEYLVETASEVSAAIIIETEVGVESAGSPMIADRIVDMRPEASLGDALRSRLPDLLARKQ